MCTKSYMTIPSAAPPSRRQVLTPKVNSAGGNEKHLLLVFPTSD